MSVAHFIAAQRTEHRVPHAKCCRWLGVSVSWFYKWHDPGENDMHTDWARSAWDAFSPHLHDAVSYINHLNGDERPEQVRASYGRNLQRLRTIKQTFDPANTFRMNPNIT